MSTNNPLGGLGNLIGSLVGGAGTTGSGSLPAGLGDAIGGLLGGTGGSTGSGGGAGLEELVKGFQQAGLADQVESWIGHGANLPVTAEQVGQALGPDKVQQLASSTGLEVAQLLPMLAAFLPQVVDALTPNGRLPQAGDSAPGSG
ncbi:MAG: YidB family protein [Candidatus Limnocylindrales bacterium]